MGASSSAVRKQREDELMLILFIIGVVAFVLFFAVCFHIGKSMEEDELKLIERGVQRALDAREKRK